MFSHNGKISEKQMRRMLVLPTFASGIFVLPYLSARLFGKSVFSGLLVFLVFACIYVGCIVGLGTKYCNKREGKTEERNVSTCQMGFVKAVYSQGIAGKLLLIIQILRLFIRLVFYIVLAIEILGEAQVPFMPAEKTNGVANLLVVLPLLLVVLYGAGKRIEQNARLHEMIFWVLFIPFIIMLLFGLWEVDYAVFVPHLAMPFGRLLLYGYALLTFIQPMENYLYLRPVLSEGNKHGDTSFRGINAISRYFRKRSLQFRVIVAELFVIFLAVVISLFILGIYGVNGGGSEEMVTIAIMRYIRLPLGILERFDVLMVWFFMTGCFVLLCNSLYHAGYLFKELCGKKKSGLLVIILVLAGGLVLLLPEYSDTLMLFLCYGAVLDIPLSILVPLAGLGLSEIHLKEKGGSKYEK